MSVQARLPAEETTMNHKKKRPQNRRAGCKLCKPWKINGFRTERNDGERLSDHKRRFAQSAHDPDAVQNWRTPPPRVGWR